MATKAEQTQQRILDEAARLFNVKGYAATCIRDIMEATGLKKGGIYGNFESKERIQAAAFEYGLGVVTEALAAELARYEGAVAKLHGMLDFYEHNVFDTPIEGGCIILNTAVEADDTNPALREWVVTALDRWRGRIGSIIRDGIAAGEIRRDVDHDAFTLFLIATVEGGIMLAKAYRDAAKLRAPLRYVHEAIEGMRNSEL
jgi:AcrR family transcriptional regulator